MGHAARGTGTCLCKVSFLGQASNSLQYQLSVAMIYACTPLELGCASTVGNVTSRMMHSNANVFRTSCVNTLLLTKAMGTLKRSALTEGHVPMCPSNYWAPPTGLSVCLLIELLDSSLTSAHLERLQVPGSLMPQHTSLSRPKSAGNATSSLTPQTRLLIK